MSSSTMQAVTVVKDNAGSYSIELVTVPMPELASPHDILVRVHACAINPGDLKLITSCKIRGYDGAGVVVKAGSDALFEVGDEVFYSGMSHRDGTNAQYQVVDSRVVGPKPKSLDWAEAASYPLVGLTVWELFERHFGMKAGVIPEEENTIVIVNGAGGVGSIATQLSKVFGIKNIIVTASRPETIEWVKQRGATHVINHREDLGPQIQKLGLVPNLALLCYNADETVSQLVPIMRGWSKIVAINPSTKPMEFGIPAFFKSISFHYEFLATLYSPEERFDVSSHGRILRELSKLIDEGKFKSIVTKREVLSVQSLSAGHKQIESGSTIGKLVFTIPDVLE